jgi:hypothetical protein
LEIEPLVKMAIELYRLYSICTGTISFKKNLLKDTISSIKFGNQFNRNARIIYSVFKGIFKDGLILNACKEVNDLRVRLYMDDYQHCKEGI